MPGFREAGQLLPILSPAELGKLWICTCPYASKAAVDRTGLTQGASGAGGKLESHSSNSGSLPTHTTRALTGSHMDLMTAMEEGRDRLMASGPMASSQEGRHHTYLDTGLAP